MIEMQSPNGWRSLYPSELLSFLLQDITLYHTHATPDNKQVSILWGESGEHAGRPLRSPCMFTTFPPKDGEPNKPKIHIGVIIQYTIVDGDGVLNDDLCKIGCCSLGYLP